MIVVIQYLCVRLGSILKNGYNKQMTSRKHHLEEIRRNKKEAQSKVADFLSQQTRFEWASPRNFWAGYNRESLTVLVAQIATEIGITNEQAKNIFIQFSDCGRDNAGNIPLASTTVASNGAESLPRCSILINRSRRAYEEFAKNLKNRKTREIESQPNIQYSSNLTCRIDTTREFLIWILTEELYHAKLYCMAKTYRNDTYINVRYNAIRRKKGISFSDLYENDYQEMTVARNCLLLLAKFVPEKANYYRSVYKESLETGARPVPRPTADVMRAMYTPTGFSLRTLINLYFK